MSAMSGGSEHPAFGYQTSFSMQGRNMKNAPLSEDIALRIGLAARVLPGTDPARLLRVLADAVGLPPMAAKLATLKVKDLKVAAGGDLADLDQAVLKEAVAILRGEVDMDVNPPPPVDACEDLAESIRVVCASDNGEQLDGHFGSCRRFLIYQVSSAGVRLVAVRDAEEAAAQDDKNAYRASLIADCQILYVASIGGPAAAKVVKVGVHPIKWAGGGSARDRVTALQSVLAQRAPPWLAKAMGLPPEARVRFEREDTQA
jgi:nitrogen fixation protein NifX